MSFATFENICWLTENGAGQLDFLLLRGFGTGAMHVVCGATVAAGLVYAWRSTWLRVAGTAGILCAAVTFHAMYNLLLSAGGVVQIFGYVMPIAGALLGYTALKLLHLPTGES